MTHDSQATKKRGNLPDAVHTGESPERNLTRRQFLKAAGAVAGSALAGGIMDMPSGYAAAGQGIPEIDRVSIRVIADNYFEAMRPSGGIIENFSSPEVSMHAEHGLSFHIETDMEGGQHRFLFDYGADLHGFNKNVRLLGIDLDQVEALALSHGHLDHWGNLPALLKQQQTWLQRGISLHVGEETFLQRFVKRKNGIVDLGHLDKAKLEALNSVAIVEVAEPTAIVPGAYLTGRIERTVEFEKGMAGALIQRSGEYVQDLFPGEQALVFNVRNKGLVVLTGCAHAGVINTVRHAQKISGVEKVHAVLGGFHLIGSTAELKEQTIAAMRALKPDYIVPMHCTGFEGVTEFARRMPGQFVLGMAGSRYTFAA